MPTYKYIIIVGYNRLGLLLASHLNSLGSNIVIIDENDPSCVPAASEFGGFKISGNAAQPDVLRRAKIDKADCLLAVTHQDNMNLMVAQVARTIFNVPRVIARVVDPKREAIYRQFDIEIINPTKLCADAFLCALQEPVRIERL